MVKMCCSGRRAIAHGKRLDEGIRFAVAHGKQARAILARLTCANLADLLRFHGLVVRQGKAVRVSVLAVYVYSLLEGSFITS